MLIFCLCQAKHVNLTMIYLIYRLRGFMFFQRIFFFKKKKGKKDLLFFFFFFFNVRTCGSPLIFNKT
jgi:hypothetical protein